MFTEFVLVLKFYKWLQ